MMAKLWTPQRLHDLAELIVAKTLSHVPDHLLGLFDKLKVTVVPNRDNQRDNMAAVYSIDGVHYCDKESWYQVGSNANTIDNFLIKALSISDAVEQQRQSGNSVMIENNLLTYLQQWLSDNHILDLISDTTRGIKLGKDSRGNPKTMTTSNDRTIEIIERGTTKMQTQVAMHIGRGCLFGSWRLSPEAKWDDHGIVVHGTYPLSILGSMSKVSDIIIHPTLNPELAVTKAKASQKTTRFNVAVQVTTRKQMVCKAAKCPGNGPYFYRTIRRG